MGKHWLQRRGGETQAEGGAGEGSPPAGTGGVPGRGWRRGVRSVRMPARRGQGRTGRGDAAGSEEGRPAQGRSDPGSQGKGSAAGSPRPPGPAAGPGGDAEPHLKQGRAAAAAQVAKPGGGGASSPSPRPAAVEGEVALKGAGAARVRTSARGPRWRRIRWGRGERVASPRGQNQEGSRTQKTRKLLRRSWGRWWIALQSTWRALPAGTQDFHKGG